MLREISQSSKYKYCTILILFKTIIKLTEVEWQLLGTVGRDKWEIAIQ
jgi:hypothetical protein